MAVPVCQELRVWLKVDAMPKSASTAGPLSSRATSRLQVTHQHMVGMHFCKAPDDVMALHQRLCHREQGACRQ
jgi:hypothetical protein